MTIVNLQKVHDFVYEEYPIFDIFLFGMVMFVDQLFYLVVRLNSITYHSGASVMTASIKKESAENNKSWSFISFQLFQMKP